MYIIIYIGGFMNRITTIAELRNHIEGVWARSEHHAHKVVAILPILVGNIVSYADIDENGLPEIWTLSPRATGDQYTGNSVYTGNVVWIKVKGHRIFFTYDHATGKVVIKERGNQGEVLQTFDDINSISDINSLFSGLNAA